MNIKNGLLLNFKVNLMKMEYTGSSTHRPVILLPPFLTIHFYNFWIEQAHGFYQMFLCLHYCIYVFVSVRGFVQAAAHELYAMFGQHFIEGFMRNGFKGLCAAHAPAGAVRGR